MSEPTAIRFRQSFLERAEEGRAKQRPSPGPRHGEVIPRLC